MGCSYKESAAINLIIALGTVLALDFPWLILVCGLGVMVV